MKGKYEERLNENETCLYDDLDITGRDISIILRDLDDVNKAYHWSDDIIVPPSNWYCWTGSYACDPKDCLLGDSSPHQVIQTNASLKSFAQGLPHV